MKIDLSIPPGPPSEIEQLRRALAFEQAGLAGCLEDLKDMPDDPSLLNEQARTLARIDTFQKDLDALEQRQRRAERDRTAGKSAYIKRMAELALRAKQDGQRLTIADQECTERAEALAATIAKRNVVMGEAHESFVAAMQPLLGERFGTSALLHLGLLPCPLWDDIAKALKAHEHDSHSPIEAARSRSDRVADALDTEIDNLKNEGTAQ